MEPYIYRFGTANNTGKVISVLIFWLIFALALSIPAFIATNAIVGFLVLGISVIAGTVSAFLLGTFKNYADVDLSNQMISIKGSEWRPLNMVTYASSTLYRGTYSIRLGFDKKYSFYVGNNLFGGNNQENKKTLLHILPLLNISFEKKAEIESRMYDTRPAA